MNLRVLVNPKEAEGHPLEMFFVGAAYAFLSVLLGAWLFPENAGLAIIAITVAASTPIFYSIVRFEAANPHRRFIREHRKAITVLAFLFLGFVAGYLVGFFVLPSGLRETTFIAQAQAITKLTGAFKGVWGSYIIQNNFRVLLFSFLLSIFFGTGSILVLAWNASVLAVALGSFILHKVAAGSPMITAVAASFAKYLIHGIPEMIAYFIGGLAGGMVFYSIISKKYTRTVIFEAVALLLLSVIILLLAAIIEVYIEHSIV